MTEKGKETPQSKTTSNTVREIATKPNHQQPTPGASNGPSTGPSTGPGAAKYTSANVVPITEAKNTQASKRILVVEPSSTMRHVLTSYVEEQGYNVETYSSYADAAAALKTQFDSFDADFDCVLLGWPATRDRESARLLGMLEGVDYHDLPVVVLSQDMRADSRAWVAARDHSVMLRWKDYRSTRQLMENLLDQGHEERAESPTSKFSNDDIRILVVDDSASIRYALRDLLQLHGYNVTVVGTFDEGMDAARSSIFDIALLDYYLQEATGDELCRALLDDEATGNLICTILTGTYSDHIIKRSLKAGAVECMFKNESSELLLARIDALSRLVRQRNMLKQQREDMNAVIHAIAGSVMVFDTSGTITYANDAAREILGHKNELTLIGHGINSVNPDIPRAIHGKSMRGLFSARATPPVDVLFKCSDFKLSGVSAGTILVFRSREELEAAGASVQENDQRTLFLKNMATKRKSPAEEGEMLTLLMLDIGFVDADKSLKPVAVSQHALNGMTAALKQTYQRSNQVAYLGDSKFGILLSHATEAQAYLLARKIMQISNDIGAQTRLGEFSCTGALLRLDKNPELNEGEVIQRCQEGLRLVESRGRNNALLLDLRRMLPVYPKTAQAS